MIDKSTSFLSNYYEKQCWTWSLKYATHQCPQTINVIIFKGFALFQKALPIIITSSKSSTSTNKANILAKFLLRCHQLWLLTDKFSFRNLSFTDNIYDWAVTCLSTIWLVAFRLIVFAPCAQGPLSLITCHWPICRLSSWQKHNLKGPPPVEGRSY